MSLAILFHFLCAQHVSDINIPIIRSLRLFCWITTLVVLFLVRCVLEFRCGWVGVVSVLQAASAYPSRTVAPCDLYAVIRYTKQCCKLYLIFTLHFLSSTQRRQNTVRHTATRTGFHERTCHVWLMWGVHQHGTPVCRSSVFPADI